MKSTLLLILTCCYILNLSAQSYDVSLIPDSLKTDAFVVVRTSSKEVELTDVNKGKAKYKVAYTILNKVGEDQAYLIVPFNKETSVSINSATMFDKYGEKIRKIKPTEIVDIPAYSGALFSDNRVMAFKPNYAQIPYTIEYEYEVTSTNMISQGIWSPYTNYNQSIQSNKFSITFPKEITLNKKEFGLSSSTSSKPNGDFSFHWETQNLKALVDEPFSPSIFEVVPCVYLMTSVIKWDDYVGSSTNWKEYGKWAYSLYNGRSELCEAEKLKINSLLLNTPDTLEKMKKLYSYMQERTRYVGIQVGIGGFQPFDATTVYETGYGDCKALTNYMYSLLKYVGIKSFPALVGSGSYIQPILMDFPNFHQFNHVILAVPYQNDTIWLETTSQSMPFGFLGDFTDDRDVLLLSSEGGKFAHTTKYLANDNTKTSKISLVIDDQGNATGSISTNYKALQFNKISYLFERNSDEQKKWLYEDCKFPSPQINSYTISQNKNIIPDATIIQEISSRNYASFSGNYMIIPLNVSSKMEAVTKMLKPRHSEIIISRDKSYCDSITISIPTIYKFETIPLEKKIESKFGMYSYNVSIKGNTITYYRNLTIFKGRHAPSAYKDFYDTMLAISKADGIKIMATKTL